MKHKKLISLRKLKNITQAEMAMKLGYSNKSGYCQLENGIVKMTLDKALEISKILETDVDEIFFDTNVQATRTPEKNIESA